MRLRSGTAITLIGLTLMLAPALGAAADEQLAALSRHPTPGHVSKILEGELRAGSLARVEYQVWIEDADRGGCQFYWQSTSRLQDALWWINGKRRQGWEIVGISFSGYVLSEAQVVACPGRR